MKTRKRFYRWSYYNPRKGQTQLKPHQLRDADAFTEISPALYQQEYEYGGIILNYPVIPKTEKPPLRWVDDSFIKPDDLIVMTTRPPIHDHISEYRKKVLRSFTTLEKKLFDKLDPYLKISTRLLMEITPELAAKLPRAYKNRACIEVLESGATYKSLRTQRAGRPQSGRNPVRTACYFFYLPRTRNRDHNLLCVFGMGGTETLIWSYLLRTRFPKKLILDRPRFILAELYPMRIPKRPDDLSFADRWKLDFIADIPL
jgi:hypothetical protein